MGSGRFGYQCKKLPSTLFKLIPPSAYNLPVCAKGLYRCLLPVSFIELYNLHPLLCYLILIKSIKAMEHMLKPPIASHSTKYRVCLRIMIHYSLMSHMYLNLFTCGRHKPALFQNDNVRFYQSRNIQTLLLWVDRRYFVFDNPFFLYYRIAANKLIRMQLKPYILSILFLLPIAACEKNK